MVNALTPLHHPCQALADLLTLEERFGKLEGLRLAYVGDGNNVCNSLMLLGSPPGLQVAVATPPELRPDEQIVAAAGDAVELTTDPRVAAEGAHALYTDVWISMGDEAEAERRRELLAPYQLNESLLGARQARRDRAALPAGSSRRGDHRGPALRGAVGGLGSGREPAARAEGAARASCSAERCSTIGFAGARRTGLRGWLSATDRLNLIRVMPA